MPSSNHLLTPIETTFHSHAPGSSRSSSRAPSFVSTATSLNSPPATQRLLEEGYVDENRFEDDHRMLNFPAALLDVLQIRLYPEPDRENKFSEKRRSQSPKKRWNLSVGSRLIARAIRYLAVLAVCMLITSLIWHVTSACYEPFDEYPTFLDDTPKTHDGPKDRHWFHAGVTGYSYHGPAFDNILPIPCHSHNDYSRAHPLFSALRSGCVSVEADVWLFGEELFIGHDPKSLNRKSTLQSLYLDPLRSILNSTNDGFASTGAAPNGVFGKDPAQTLLLLIDFKTSGPDTYHKVSQQLAPLRDMGLLTTWNGTQRIERPITVVASGNVDFGMIQSNEHNRDIFFDAPLAALAHASDPVPAFDAHSAAAQNVYEYYYNPSNSYFASGSLKKSVGWKAMYWFGTDAVSTIREQVSSAHERGLTSRYWGHASFPPNIRDHTWELLLEEQIGMLNVDDLKAVKRLARGMRSARQ